MSDEFEEVGFILEENEEEENGQEVNTEVGIMNNIANIISELDGTSDLVTKLEDQKVKKSFEMKYVNDDDDEIFIVHDEGEFIID